MIARHIPMQSVRVSDFAKLADYITDPQSKTERVGQIRVTNCQSVSAAAATAEILATQRQNTRARGDKTFHLLVAFPPGEKPSAETLRAIEKRLCAGLGYGQHQRISAVHHDTDHMHVHIAINKIHPERLTMHEPFRPYRTLGELCDVMEREYGLQRVNHISKRSLSEGRARDMERHSGVESLVGWIKRECLDEIRAACTWAELHQVMRENGLQLLRHANGFVIEAKDGTTARASTVARDLSKSKLEARLGPFEPSQEGVEGSARRREYTKRPVPSSLNTAELYARYQEEQRALVTERSKAIGEARARRDRRIKAAKRAGSLRRDAIKLLGGPRAAKKVFYARVNNALRDEIQQIKKRYQKERAAAYEQHSRRAWADWLKHKALKGDNEALAALRARAEVRGLKGDTIQGTGDTVPVQPRVIDGITKRGTIIYRAGESAIRDDGQKLQVSREATASAVEHALRMAMERYGRRISVNGSAIFKAQAIRAAVAAKLPITFADPSLESRRQALLRHQQERTHERSTTQLGRRADRRGLGHAGPGSATGQRIASTTRLGIAAGHGGREPSNSERTKPHVERVGRVPPPQSRHRLRTLSELGLVRIAGGSEVLLPRYVSRHMDKSRAERNHTLRRPSAGSGVGGVSPQIAAADKYIAEREAKRKQGFDIKKHCRYNGEAGVFLYAGTRAIDGQLFALLERGADVLVKHIDEATARRLKTVGVGEQITISLTGSIKISKRRSRSR